MNVKRFWYVTFLLLLSICQKCEAGRYYYNYYIYRSRYYYYQYYNYYNYYYYYYYYYYYTYTGHLSGGAIAGIVIGSIFSVAILVFAFAACTKQCNKKSTRVMSISTVPGSNIMTTRYYQQQPPHGHEQNSRDPPPYSSRLSAPPPYSSRRSLPPPYQSQQHGHASNPFAVDS